MENKICKFCGQELIISNAPHEQWRCILNLAQENHKLVIEDLKKHHDKILQRACTLLSFALTEIRAWGVDSKLEPEWVKEIDQFLEFYHVK